MKDNNDLKIGKAKEFRVEYMTRNTSYKADVCTTKIQRRLMKKDVSTNGCSYAVGDKNDMGRRIR